MFGERINCDRARLMVAEGAQLVDVRTAQEYAYTRVPGSTNIPLHELSVAQAELDRSRPVLVFCRTGARSEQAKMFLKSMGFERVMNVGSFQTLLGCVA